MRHRLLVLSFFGTVFLFWNDLTQFLYVSLLIINFIIYVIVYLEIRCEKMKAISLRGSTFYLTEITLISIVIASNTFCKFINSFHLHLVVNKTFFLSEDIQGGKWLLPHLVVGRVTHFGHGDISLSIFCI